MVPCLAYEHGREAEPEGGEGDAEVEGFGSQAVPRGDVAGDERGDGDGAIAGGFVQPEGEAAAGGADEVDLHDDRR